MTIPTVWLTDDPCPACGAVLTELPSPGHVLQECRTCGWTVTWAADGG
jgi:hypothetical protein